MNAHKLLLAVALVATLFRFTLRSSQGAEIVSFSFTGYLTSVFDPSKQLPASITANALVTGTISYDPNGKADGFPPPDSTNGVYYYSDGGYSFTLAIAGNVFTNQVSPVGGNQVYVTDNFGGFEDYAQYLIRDPLLNGVPLPGPVAYAGLGMTFIDDTGTALPSDALPLTAPALTKFSQSRQFYLTANPTNGNDYVYYFEGSVTNISPISPIQPVLGVSNLKAGKVELSFDTLSGKIYRLQLNSNLATTNWSDVQTNVGNGMRNTIQVDSSLPQAFYRLQLE